MSFTSHTGPVPQSSIHNNLPPSCLLMQTKGETTIPGSRGRAKLILQPISFNLKPRPDLEQENWALLVTQQQSVWLRDQLPSTCQKQELQAFESCSAAGKDLTRLFLDKYQLPFSLFYLWDTSLKTKICFKVFTFVELVSPKCLSTKSKSQRIKVSSSRVLQTRLGKKYTSTYGLWTHISTKDV